MSEHCKNALAPPSRSPLPFVDDEAGGYARQFSALLDWQDSMSQITENTVEEAALSWFGNLGYETHHGEQIVPVEPNAERASYDDVVLVGRLRVAINQLSPDIPAQAREEALRKVLTAELPLLIVNNRKFHQMLRDGVEVEYNRPDGSITGDRVRVVSDDPAENDFLAVNQFTVVEGQTNCRPDVVVFLNGLPVAVFELKGIMICRIGHLLLKGCFRLVSTPLET